MEPGAERRPGRGRNAKAKELPATERIIHRCLPIEVPEFTRR